MTYSQAVKRAIQAAKQTGRDFFVVDDGSYSDSGWIPAIAVASDRDLDGFYAGISENRILFCTGE